ncbi:hypothetical protein JTE90_017273 [Oedothorax gibbosus]|uniref:IkappaB kinase n=1 Tax=Oedothorax gibbosus TaxID=931172 RepID=A0AAV6VFN3_9ARAC|nr:hypothetical protein JTE90_017273 [Oedothorax gibbosus]
MSCVFIPAQVVTILLVPHCVAQNSQIPNPMSTHHEVEEIGKWKKEGMLGAGGFGYVVLWRNKETEETIALKECRWGHDPMMTPKHRSRWKLEVDMMSRLNHPNVVRGIPVPPELDVPATEMPLLAMEYCSNGDLRKLLNKSENCCGLQEKQARLIMKHVSSAVNYLHSMRIIHRDLKPENIVIQEKNGNVVYKLIDLGYAKELDQGSLCTSFVGTLQYLAPELFTSQKYSCTVDYWSLGLLTHEVITGSRPFLPDKSPAEWIPIIKAKKSTEIRAYLDEDKNIVFSSEIAPFHHISSTLKNDVEQWLQVMLEWDPKKRGRYENASAFNFLEFILQKKMVSVFCPDTLKLVSFPLNERLSLEDFRHELEFQTGIPVNQQSIIFLDGHLPDEEKGSSQFASCLEEEELVVFLFDENDSSSNSLPPFPYEIPVVVEKMMRQPNEKMPYLVQKNVWSQAVFHSQRECTLFHRLLNSLRAILMHAFSCTFKVRRSMSNMTNAMNQLLAKASLFKNSLEQDIKSYDAQTKEGFESKTLHESWKETYENLKKVDLLIQKITSLETTTSAIITEVVDLQKFPLVRSKVTSNLDVVHRDILDSYAELRHRSSDEKRQSHDNKDFVRLLCLCLQHSHTQAQNLVSITRKLKQSKRRLEDSQQQYSSLFREISHWNSQIDAWQSLRQKSLWKVIRKLCEQVHRFEFSKTSEPVPHGLVESSSTQNSSASPSKSNSENDVSYRQPPKHSVLQRTPPVITPPSWQSRYELLTMNSCVNGNDTIGKSKLDSSMLTDTELLSSLLEKSSEESRKAKNENAKLIESFQNMMEVIKSYPAEEFSNNNHNIGR